MDLFPLTSIRGSAPGFSCRLGLPDSVIDSQSMLVQSTVQCPPPLTNPESAPGDCKPKKSIALSLPLHICNSFKCEHHIGFENHNENILMIFPFRLVSVLSQSLY